MRSFIIPYEMAFNSFRLLKDFFNDLKAGDKNHMCICYKYQEGSLIERDDLIFLMEPGQGYPSLLAMGKAVTDYAVNETGKTIEIHFDFMQGSNKDFTMTSTLLKEAGVSFTKNDSETMLSDELTEKLVKRFAVVHMACAYPHDSFSYNPDRDKKQLLCDYLNDYCPEFRLEVINRFPPVYKNYKEGDVIDKSLMDLTYDKSVTRFPGACLDWNLLFDIVRPRA